MKYALATLPTATSWMLSRCRRGESRSRPNTHSPRKVDSRKNAIINLNKNTHRICLETQGRGAMNSVMPVLVHAPIPTDTRILYAHQQKVELYFLTCILRSFIRASGTRILVKRTFACVALSFAILKMCLKSIAYSVITKYDFQQHPMLQVSEVCPCEPCENIAARKREGSAAQPSVLNLVCNLCRIAVLLY